MIESLPCCRTRALRLLHPGLSGLTPCCSGALVDMSELVQVDAAALKAELLRVEDADEPDLTLRLVQQVLKEDACPLDGLFLLSNHLLDFRHGQPVCSQQALWHHISWDLDKDLLVAARLAEERQPDPAPGLLAALAWPSVLTATVFQLDGLLYRDVVDSHVHLGGALPASFYWMALMCNFTVLERLGAWRIDSELWPSLLRQAIVVRKELAFDLFSCRANDHLFDAPAPWDEKVPPEPFVDYILRMLVPQARDRIDLNPVLGERYLLWQALWEIRHNGGRKQPWFGKFLAYVQVRNSFIRHLSYRHGYRGLERYRDHHALRWAFSPGRERSSHNRKEKRRTGRERAHDRDRRALLIFERFRMRHALRYQFSDPTDAPWARQYARAPSHVPTSPWRPPRQVEIRVSPWRGYEQQRMIYQYLSGFADFVRCDKDAPLIRFGLCFHLIRANEAFHHQDYDRCIASGLEGILQSVPAFRPFIVGVDVAGSEKRIAPRDYAAFFQQIRQIDRGQRPMPGTPPIRLKRTMHAGEDFDDQLTGLRYMDDVLHLAKFEVGERLGHGLALFFKPATWYQGRSQLHKRRLDHLLDLLWARYFCLNGATAIGLLRQPQTALCVRDLFEEHFQADLILLNRMDELFTRYNLLSEFPSERHLYQALFEDDCAESLMVIRVTPAYVAMVEQLHAMVQQRVSAHQVVLEACPTSNMLISKLGSYSKLPYANINRTGLKHDDLEHPVLLTLNTDNPGNLNTTIANEYRLLALGMQEQGVPMRETLNWLEAIRQTSVAATFIPPWNPPTKKEFLYFFRNLFKSRTH